MPKHTLNKRLCAGLLALGYKREPSHSRYDTFSNPVRPGYYLFVGESGALREGKCASRSYSLLSPRAPFYDKALAAGDAILAAPAGVDKYA